MLKMPILFPSPLSDKYKTIYTAQISVNEMSLDPAGTSMLYDKEYRMPSGNRL